MTLNMCITTKTWITLIIHIEGPIRSYGILLEQRRCTFLTRPDSEVTMLLVPPQRGSIDLLLREGIANGDSIDTRDLWCRVDNIMSKTSGSFIFNLRSLGLDINNG